MTTEWVDDVDIKPLLSTKDHGDTASDDGDKEELDSRDRYTDRGMPDHVPRKGAGRRCAWPSVPVEFIVTLYALSACGTGTITEQLLYTKISLRHNVSSVVFEDRDDSKCSSNHTSNLHFDDYQMIQAEASYWLVYIKLARCLPGVLVTLISGTVSDRISRKLPIILPIAASFVQNFILLMISVLNLPLPWFMVGSLVDGLSGSIYTLMMGCYAYLGDSVVREKRSFKIVLVECLRGLADVAAYIAAGYAVKYLGFTPPFISTTTLLFISLISALFFLPSTSKTENKTDNTFPNDSDTPTCSKYHIFDTCIFLRNVFRRKTRGLVLLCILILCCFINGEYSRGGPQILLQQNVPFCWNAKVIGLYMATQAFIHSLLMVFIVGVFQKRVGDVALVCVGSAGGAVSVFVQAFSVNTPMLFSGIYK